MEWGRLGWAMSVSLLTAQDTSTLAPARPLEFELNSFHSRVEFSVPFMKLTSVKGSFEDFSGLLLYDRDRPTRSSVTFVIRSASLHTGNTLRDKHLRSDDFFDVERYPTIVYRSERIEARGSDRYLVRGSLTMHGTTRRVGLPIRVRHRLVSDESGVDYLGFDGAIRLDWREFGIPGGNRNNGWFQPSKMLVNDSVNIALSMEADRRVPSRIHYPALDSARQVVERAGVQELIRRYNRVAAGHSDSVESFCPPIEGPGSGARGDRPRERRACCPAAQPSSPCRQCRGGSCLGAGPACNRRFGCCRGTLSTGARIGQHQSRRYGDAASSGQIRRPHPLRWAAWHAAFA
jgi:polyisoprenoid-binding protein YceI